MNVYETRNIGDLLENIGYAGRGIVIGRTEDGRKAAIAYFLMGRSQNSRNRIFREEGEEVIINAFDPSKLEDPTLIIYSPIKRVGDKLIVTNGDQTDTVEEFLQRGESFEAALETREFEPDAPNLTPRISGLLDLKTGSYKMSILKSANAAGTACDRYTYSYASVAGSGHFLHTYQGDGNPLPTFAGEPKRVNIPDSPDELAQEIWNNLDAENKISLYVRYIDLTTGEIENRMLNKNN